jgi:hypothetical protein
MRLWLAASAAFQPFLLRNLDRPTDLAERTAAAKHRYIGTFPATAIEHACCRLFAMLFEGLCDRGKTRRHVKPVSRPEALVLFVFVADQASIR